MYGSDCGETRSETKVGNKSNGSHSSSPGEKQEQRQGRETKTQKIGEPRRETKQGNKAGKQSDNCKIFGDQAILAGDREESIHDDVVIIIPWNAIAKLKFVDDGLTTSTQGTFKLLQDRLLFFQRTGVTLDSHADQILKFMDSETSIFFHRINLIYLR